MVSKYTCLSAFITAMMFFILFCTMVAQKVLQHFLFFSQNKHEMLATYSVVNLECPVRYCSAAKQCFLAHALGVVKMAWCGDVS
jgi:hypothetical protein